MAHFPTTADEQATYHWHIGLNQTQLGEGHEETPAMERMLEAEGELEELHKRLVGATRPLTEVINKLAWYRTILVSDPNNTTTCHHQPAWMIARMAEVEVEVAEAVVEDEVIEVHGEAEAKHQSRAREGQVEVGGLHESGDGAIWATVITMELS
jgi:hypothetical protein